MKIFIFLAIVFVQNICEQVPTFITLSTWDSLKSNGIPFLQRGAKYLFPSYSFPTEFDLFLCEVYHKAMSEPKYVIDKLAQSMDEGNNLLTKGNAGYKYENARNNLTNIYSSSNSLEKAVVYVYTTYYIYKDLVSATRKIGSNVNATPVEETLASFALVLNGVLFHWTMSQSVSQVTYRGVGLNASDLAQYTTGTKFVWPTFSSSSTNKSVAESYIARRTGEKVLFIINNSKVTTWRPKYIGPYAFDPSHQEALFSIGAMFYVTATYNVTDELGDLTNIINLDLISSSSEIVLDRYILVITYITINVIDWCVLF